MLAILIGRLPDRSLHGTIGRGDWVSIRQHFWRGNAPIPLGRRGSGSIGRRPWWHRGANDPSFVAAGATAFHADLPDAEIHLLNAGHFALDEKNDEIAALILAFMAEHVLAR